MLQVKRTITGSYPITLQESKDWLKVDGTADDTLITSLIEQVVDLAETYLNMTIVKSTLEVFASPRKQFVLPYSPVEIITSVTDTDLEPVDYTWNGFYIEFDSLVVSVTGGDSGYVDTITTYDSGLDEIPQGLKIGLLECIAWLYENRGDNAGFQMMLYRNQNLQPFRQGAIWI